MTPFLGQVEFALPAGSPQLWTAITITLVAGFALFFGLMAAPSRIRRPVVVSVTFLAGMFWMVEWLWPMPVELAAAERPLNSTEAFGKALQDGVPVVSNITQTIAILLLLLGVYSVLRIHVSRLLKKQKDWVFSLILLISLATMVSVGYRNYFEQSQNPQLINPANWGPTQRTFDFLFDGMLQAMDAAMFSIIAFFILFAAYRAFRIRSVESTVLLGSALIVMLALMGGVEYYFSRTFIDGITGGDPGHFATNLSLTEVSGWIRGNVQTPGIRALEWGLFIGALSMGLRLWLSIERTGGS